MKNVKNAVESEGGTAQGGIHLSVNYGIYSNRMLSFSSCVCMHIDMCWWETRLVHERDLEYAAKTKERKNFPLLVSHYFLRAPNFAHRLVLPEYVWFPTSTFNNTDSATIINKMNPFIPHQYDDTTTMMQIDKENDENKTTSRVILPRDARLDSSYHDDAITMMRTTDTCPPPAKQYQHRLPLKKRKVQYPWHRDSSDMMMSNNTTLTPSSTIPTTTILPQTILKRQVASYWSPVHGTSDEFASASSPVDGPYDYLERYGEKALLVYPKGPQTLFYHHGNHHTITTAAADTNGTTTQTQHWMPLLFPPIRDPIEFIHHNKKKATQSNYSTTTTRNANQDDTMAATIVADKDDDDDVDSKNNSSSQTFVSPKTTTTTTIPPDLIIVPTRTTATKKIVSKAKQDFHTSTGTSRQGVVTPSPAPPLLLPTDNKTTTTPSTAPLQNHHYDTKTRPCCTVPHDTPAKMTTQPKTAATTTTTMMMTMTTTTIKPSPIKPRGNKHRFSSNTAVVPMAGRSAADPILIDSSDEDDLRTAPQEGSDTSIATNRAIVHGVPSKAACHPGANARHDVPNHVTTAVPPGPDASQTAPAFYPIRQDRVTTTAVQGHTNCSQGANIPCSHNDATPKAKNTTRRPMGKATNTAVATTATTTTVAKDRGMLTSASAHTVTTSHQRHQRHHYLHRRNLRHDPQPQQSQSVPDYHRCQPRRVSHPVISQDRQRLWYEEEEEERNGRIQGPDASTRTYSIHPLYRTHHSGRRSAAFSPHK